MNQTESVHTFWIFCSSSNARVAHTQYLRQCCLMRRFSRPELKRESKPGLDVWQLIKPLWPSGFVGKICHTLTVARKTEFKLRPVGWNHISNPLKWIVILSITAQSLACGETHKSSSVEEETLPLPVARVLNICLHRSASLDLSFFGLSLWCGTDRLMQPLFQMLCFGGKQSWINYEMLGLLLPPKHNHISYGFLSTEMFDEVSSRFIRFSFATSFVQLLNISYKP